MDDDGLDLPKREELPAVARRACPNCGATIEPNVTFCARCGTPVTAPVSPARPWFQRLKDVGEVVIAAPFVILFGLVVIYRVPSSS